MLYKVQHFSIWAHDLPSSSNKPRVGTFQACRKLMQASYLLAHGITWESSYSSLLVQALFQATAPNTTTSCGGATNGPHWLAIPTKPKQHLSPAAKKPAENFPRQTRYYDNEFHWIQWASCTTNKNATTHKRGGWTRNASKRGRFVPSTPKLCIGISTEDPFKRQGSFPKKIKKISPEHAMCLPRIVARSCSNIDNRRLLQFIGSVLIFEFGFFKSGNTRHRTGRLEIRII